MKKNLIGSAQLALDAELVLYSSCEWTEKRESRLKQRNFDLILFFESACVKENRKLPPNPTSLTRLRFRIWS